MNTLDRDAARKVLSNCIERGTWLYVGEDRIDALEQCIRPDPQQTIDRASLIAILYAIERDDLDKSIAADRILALLRPAEGVVLTREEAAVSQTAINRWIGQCAPDSANYLRQIRARLEATS